jgi:peptide-methionine (S)-S-oxide reductase
MKRWSAGTLALLIVIAPMAMADSAKAVFAGGCFWCTESDFEKVPGVLSARSGYAGGKQASPTYEQVSSGTTGHAEAVEVTYDSARVSYEQLLDVFWHSVDPLAKNAQFCDQGTQYRTAIFYGTAAEQRAAEATRQQLTDSKVLKGPIQTEILPLTRFWPAEEYHQDYYKKNTLRYKLYRLNCGRDARLKELWGEAAGRYPGRKD